MLIFLMAILIPVVIYPARHFAWCILHMNEISRVIIYSHDVSSVQSLSYVRLFATPWTAARQASLSITNSWSLLKFMFIESVMPPNLLSSVPFSSHLQPFLASGSFPRSRFFASGGQNTRVSASASVFPVNIQD